MLCLDLDVGCHLVVPNDILPERPAIHSAAQLGTQQETSTKFSIQTVCLVWRRRQSVLEHRRYQLLDFVRDGLAAKVVGLFCEWNRQ
jgi:hypothetical protein